MDLSFIISITSKSTCLSIETGKVPESIPSITLNVNSLLTSSGCWHSFDGHNKGYPIPLNVKSMVSYKGKAIFSCMMNNINNESVGKSLVSYQYGVSKISRLILVITHTSHYSSHLMAWQSIRSNKPQCHLTFHTKREILLHGVNFWNTTPLAVNLKVSTNFGKLNPKTLSEILASNL